MNFILKKKEHRIMLFMAALFFTSLVTIYFIKLYTMRLPLYDHGSYYYVIENLRLNHSWIYFREGYTHWLGIHFSLITLLIVPFHYISSSPMTMLILQAFVASIGVHAMYLIGKHFFKDDSEWTFRLILVLAYISYLPLSFSLSWDADVLRFAPAFILYFLYFAILKNNDLKAIPFALILISTRETLPLLIAGTGIYIFIFNKNRLRGSIYFLTGVAIFLFLNFYLMPYFRQANPNLYPTGGPTYLKYQYPYISGQSISEITIFLMTHPLLVLKNIFFVPSYKLLIFAGLFALLLFIPLVRLRYLLITIMTIGIYSLSVEPSIFKYQGQYLLEIFMPFFISFAHGLKDIKDSRLKFISTDNLLKMAVVLFISSFMFNFSAYAYTAFQPYLKHKDTIENIKYVIKTDQFKLKDKDAAIFVHNRIGLLLNWHKYMATLYNFNNVYESYLKDPEIKRWYYISFDTEDYGATEFVYHLQDMEKIKKLGFKKIYGYNEFSIYKKE